MEPEKLIVIGVVSFLMAILSGIGGGGGGFIGTPLLIFLGLSPQQAIATGKIGGLGTTLGSLRGLSKAKIHNWKLVLPMMGLAAIAGLTAPLIITQLDNEVYRRLIGVLLIALIPVVLLKKIGIKPHSPALWQKIVAVPALMITLLLQGIFSSGLGSLVVLVLAGLLGMRALEANVTKRFSQVILNSLIVLGLLGSGLIVWEVAAVQFATNTVGGYAGAKIAIKRGDSFITYVFIMFMFVSGLELIFS